MQWSSEEIIEMGKEKRGRGGGEVCGGRSRKWGRLGWSKLLTNSYMHIYIYIILLNITYRYVIYNLKGALSKKKDSRF